MDRAEPNKLSKYLDKHKISQSDFARAIGVASAMVSLWVNDERRPNLDNAFKIERETGIDAEYWASRPEIPRHDPQTKAN